MRKYNISIAQAKNLYKTLKFIHDVLSKHKIRYWLTGGTLLGAVRHSGIIPWDDDGDICIMRADVPKLRKLKKTFTKHNYSLIDFVETDKESCYTSRNSCDWYITSNKFDALGVDIFVMSPKKDTITYANPYWYSAENGGKNCYFDKNHVFPLVPMRFGNFFCYTPNNPIAHLNRCYGTDWNSHSRMLYNHRLGKWMSGKPHKLKPMDFSTIKPPKQTCCNIPPPVLVYTQKHKKC